MPSSSTTTTTTTATAAAASKKETTKAKTKKSPPSDAALCKAGQAYARKQVNKMFANSNVIDKTHKFPKFVRQEVVMGKILGEGGFGIVKEIRAFHLLHDNNGGVDDVMSSKSKQGQTTTTETTTDHDIDMLEEHWREFIAQHCLRNDSGNNGKGDARYAIKYLKPDVVKDPAKFIMAIKDIAIESRFLSSVKHPHIVKMRAVATVGPYDQDYFIVMDRLYDTLEKRIERWKKRNKKCRGVMGKLVSDRNGIKAHNLLEERIVAAYDLSSAFEYLHERSIIYRDIKDENVAFDVRGDIKLFDFGLAKELHDDERMADGTFQLTAETGSIRYMAPEISRGENYNLSCDSYSFAILLWQMLALDRPFPSYMPHQVREQVHNGSKRPKISDEWDECVQDLLQKNWSAEWNHRYSMKETTDILRSYLVRMEGAGGQRHNDVDLDHARRRSTFVFRPGSRQLSSADYENSASGRFSRHSEKQLTC